MKKTFHYSLALLPILFIGEEAAAVPATCASNATVISVSCQYLDITGSSVAVTINAGVTVSAPGGVGIGLWNHASATNTSITNYGTLSAQGEMIFNQGTISNLTNFGTIGGGYHIYNTSNIGTLTNVGSINAQFRSIYNTGSITTLNNGQSGNSPLVITNSNLPLAYNIIINGTAASGNYGVLSAPNNGGAMNFNIYGNTGTTLVNGVAASTVSAGTYASVISGITAANLANAVGGKVTGTYQGLQWTLQPEATATIWDLVFRTPVTTPSATSSIAGTGLKQGAGAAGALDTIIAAAPGGDMGTVVGAFNNLSSGQQVSDAVKQTLPIMTGGVTQVTSSTLASVNRVVQARVESNRGLSSGDIFLGDKHFWMKPFVSNANQGDRNGVSGFKGNTAGAAFGADGSLTKDLSVGLAIVYAHSKVDGNDTLATPHVNVDLYSLVGYGNYSLDARTDIFVQADAGQNNNRGNRGINFGGLNRIANSSYSSTTGHVGVGISRSFGFVGQTLLIPSLRADYTVIRDGAYTETGAGALNLNVSSQTTQELVLGGSVGLSHAVNSRGTISANLGVGYDALAKRGSVTSAFAGSPGASFSTQGMDAAPWIVRAGLGYSYKFSDATDITARYDVDAKDRFINQTVSLKARRAF